MRTESQREGATREEGSGSAREKEYKREREGWAFRDDALVVVARWCWASLGVP